MPVEPDRMRHLPRDESGLAVPWFTAIVDGKPDFRYEETACLLAAAREEFGY